MKITVVSGKGGVGKTLISASLALELSKMFKVVAVDADVTTPNLGLLLKPEVIKKEEIKVGRIASPTESARFFNCPFNAIVKRAGKIKVLKYLCEGCGLCKGYGFKLEPVYSHLIHGIVNKNLRFFGLEEFTVHESGDVVNEIISRALKVEHEIILIDASAGLGCKVISALKNADLAIVVFEPSKPGEHAFKKVSKLVDFFGLRKITVLNKAGIASTKFEADFEIPFMEEIAVNISKLDLPKNKEFWKIIGEIAKRITSF